MGEFIAVGPWGTQGGLAFNHKGADGIKKMEIVHQAGIESFRVQYARDGALEWADTLGREGGDNKKRETDMVIKYPGSHAGNVILNHDFSQGLQHWSSSGGNAYIASGVNGVTTDSLGNYAVVTSRTSYSHGLKQDITGNISLGLTYNISAFVRVKGNDKRTCEIRASLILKYPDSNQINALRLGRVTVSEEHWQKLECSFSFAYMPKRVELCLVGPPPNVDLLIGPVSICPAVQKCLERESEVAIKYPSSHPDNIILNHDFSEGLKYWMTTGCNAHVASGVNGVPIDSQGNYAVATSRTEYSSGLKQNITGKISLGLTYNVSAFVRVRGNAKHTCEIRATLMLGYPDNNYESAFRLGSVTVSEERWEKLECSFTLEYMPTYISFCLIGPPPNVDLLIGPVSICPPIPKCFEVIDLDYPHEYLTSVTGHYGHFGEGSQTTSITSLTFISNQFKYGPYGQEIGTSFNFQMSGGEIVGFHGRAGKYLFAIGCFLRSINAPHQVICPCCIGNCSVSKINLVENCSELDMNKVFASGSINVPQEPGPWGGNGGQPFDDGIYHGIKQIIVYRERKALHLIQIEYDRDGESFWSQRHGSGGIMNQITLDYPNEFLIRIEGFYSPINEDKYCQALTSLTLYTNKGKYGPLGEEIGTFFSSPLASGKIRGFFGRSGKYLNALGVHMEYS